LATRTMKFRHGWNTKPLPKRENSNPSSRISTTGCCVTNTEGFVRTIRGSGCGKAKRSLSVSLENQPTNPRRLHTEGHPQFGRESLRRVRYPQPRGCSSDVQRFLFLELERRGRPDG